MAAEPTLENLHAAIQAAHVSVLAASVDLPPDISSSSCVALGYLLASFTGAKSHVGRDIDDRRANPKETDPCPKPPNPNI